jgi:outer membrane protein assembly factor BamB
VLDADQAAALRVSWRVPLETDGTSSPAVADGLLFVGTASGPVGVDPLTGAIIINYRSAPVVTTPAVIDGFDPQPDPPGTLVFGSSDGVLHAVSSAGDTLWRADLGAVPASPLVLAAIGDPTIRVIVGAGRTLFAFDRDGHRLWQAVLEGGDISRAPVAIPAQSPRLIVPVGDRLYALDAATGGVIWSVAPSRSTLGAPAIGNPNIVDDPNRIGDPGILVGDRAGTLRGSLFWRASPRWTQPVGACWSTRCRRAGPRPRPWSPTAGRSPRPVAAAPRSTSVRTRERRQTS